MATRPKPRSGGEGLPAADVLRKEDVRRHRRGAVWGIIFMASTLVGIVALTALILSIINDSFGYVAVQNEIDPATLVTMARAQNVAVLPNTTTSEDDAVLTAGVASNPYAIGFVGFAPYLDQADALRAVKVEGVALEPETAKSGQYPLARPLFLYTTETLLKNNPALAGYVNYFIEHAPEALADAGYFPMTTEEAAASAALPPSAPNAEAARSGSVAVAGSSTVSPLALTIAEKYKQDGFEGQITVDSIGSKAGFQRFCVEGTSDLALASRAMTRAEVDLCRTKARRVPLEIPIATDAIAVMVSHENTFVQELSLAQLQQIFLGAEQWSDVDPSWPDQPIVRYVPGLDSGTLDFFVSHVHGDTKLADLEQEDLLHILAANVSAGRLRALEAGQPMIERTRQEMYDLVLAEVVKPTIVQSWPLYQSLFSKAEIEATAATIPKAELEWRNWISWDFITSPQSSNPAVAGVRTAILGSLWVVLICMLFAVPLGIGTAVYLEEYSQKNWFSSLVSTNINNLAGVPSIIYGLLGLAIFVRMMEPLTSGAFFGASDPTTANGRTVISAGLTLGLLTLPLIIINAGEAIRAVPPSLREASYGLGATRWQTVWHHVLPNAISGILTGSILAVSRAVGETAPLVVVGASTFITMDPNNPFAKFTVLPTQIYQWTSRPQAEFRNLAAAASLVLLLMLLLMNSAAVYLRNRYSSQRM